MTEPDTFPMRIDDTLIHSQEMSVDDSIMNKTFERSSKFITDTNCPVSFIAKCLVEKVTGKTYYNPIRINDELD